MTWDERRPVAGQLVGGEKKPRTRLRSSKTSRGFVRRLHPEG